MPWADSHCHLQHERVGDAASPLPASAPLVDAVTAGVRRLVCVGTDEPTTRDAVAIAADAPALIGGEAEVWATAGLHPHDAKDGWDWLPPLLAEAPGNRIVAVGEAGLDYHYDFSPREQQRAAFAAQVELAHRFDLPLVIHTREAWDDTFAILASEGVPPNTVFHCFTGGPDEADRCLGLGAYISFSGIVTFKNAEDVRDALRRCPLDKVLIETDAPYLAPIPHRGKPNVPAYVPLVGRAVAAVLGLDESEVEAATWANTGAAFRLHEAARAVAAAGGAAPSNGSA